jgi:hypothetical protein
MVPNDIFDPFENSPARPNLSILAPTTVAHLTVSQSDSAPLRYAGKWAPLNSRWRVPFVRWVADVVDPSGQPKRPAITSTIFVTSPGPRAANSPPLNVQPRNPLDPSTEPWSTYATRCSPLRIQNHRARYHFNFRHCHRRREREREKEKGEGTRGLVCCPGLHTVALGDLRHFTRGPKSWPWSGSGGITHRRSKAPLLQPASRTIPITTNPLVWSLSLVSLANSGGVESRGGGNYSSLGRELHTGVNPASDVSVALPRCRGWGDLRIVR